MVEEARLWHVRLTVAGAAMEPLMVRSALHRLIRVRPFLTSLRFGADRAEITYWDEADSLLDVASLALRLWNEYREAAALPNWEVVGLEVIEQAVKLGRDKFDGMVELGVVQQP